MALLPLSDGCTSRKSKPEPHSNAATRVIVVAPVLNLSDSREFDPLKLTDAIASECTTFTGISVVPINIMLATLARRELNRVTQAEEAVWLADQLNADGTVVVAITEYQPYEPMRIGIVMQWYPRPGALPLRWFETEEELAAPLGDWRAVSAPDNPEVQVQMVFDAAHVQVLDDVKAYASKRDGFQSPSDWRRYTKSQELYARYCGWSSFRTMLSRTRVASASVGH